MKRFLTEAAFIFVLSITAGMVFNLLSENPLPVLESFDVHKTDVAIMDKQDEQVEQNKRDELDKGTSAVHSPSTATPSDSPPHPAIGPSGGNSTAPADANTAAPDNDEPVVHFQAHEIDAETVHSLVSSQSAILLDARPNIDYVQGHIPGAISLPITQFDAFSPQALSGLDPKKTIITYCIGVHCTDSTLLARKLSKKGFTDIFVFKGGIEEWQQMDFPMETSANDGKKG